MIDIKVYNCSGNSLPKYETIGSAGMDVRAMCSQPIVISPGKSAIIPTGLHVEIPVGYEIQVRSRSGLAAKKQVFVLNSPGTIDSDYRNGIGVILINLGDSDFVVENGERVALYHPRYQYASVFGNPFVNMSNNKKLYSDNLEDYKDTEASLYIWHIVKCFEDEKKLINNVKHFRLGKQETQFLLMDFPGEAG